MTDTPTKVIIDCATGEQTVVPLTQEEIEERAVLAAQVEQERLAAEAEAQAKAAARQALLDKLGITQEEAALLLS